MLSFNARAVLASAYQPEEWQVEEEARVVESWRELEHELLLVLDQRHGWTNDSEYSSHYVASIRQALAASGQ